MLPFIEAYVVCKEMGWDWWTYRNQPEPFIEVIRDMLKHRAKKK